MYTLLLITLFLATCTALLSLFLEACLRDGMILGWWLNWWADWWLQRNDRESYHFGRQLRDMNEEQCVKLSGYESEYEYKRAQVRWFWFKPMGSCIICYNVWVSTFGWLWFIGFRGGWYYVLAVVVSSFIVRYFYEKLI